MFKIKLIINEIKRRMRQRRCEHDWIVPAFDLAQHEYRVFCAKCGAEMWWGGGEE